MPSWLWLGWLPFCLAAGWLVLRRPLRDLGELRLAERARASFRIQREHLEMEFLRALDHDDPLARERWDDAEWLDEVIWARDRHSRHLLALVCVRFERNVYELDRSEHATAIFEFHDDRWHAQGHHIDALRPDEAFLRHRRLEPVELPHRSGA